MGYVRGIVLDFPKKRSFVARVPCDAMHLAVHRVGSELTLFVESADTRTEDRTYHCYPSNEELQDDDGGALQFIGSFVDSDDSVRFVYWYVVKRRPQISG